jgi:AraC-like DNA-binding protein
LPLADVALLAGFSDQPHFTREFRRKFGLTPGAFASAQLAAHRLLGPGMSPAPKVACR